MAGVFGRLLEAYRRHGYRLRTGLNPTYFDDPDAPFTHLYTDRGVKVSVGAGLAVQELYFLECLCATAFQPRNVFIVGNAFGWSALALAMLAPRAHVVAIDAAVEGAGAGVGAQLTHLIAGEEGLDVRVVNALSPRDVASVINGHFGGSLPDLVLIDGFHENDQLARDFDAVSRHASPDCVFLCHDVLHWHLLAGFSSLRIPREYERRILTRCPSGMGVVFPSAVHHSVRRAIEGFVEETIDLEAWQASAGASHQDPGPRLRTRLAAGWKLRGLGIAAIREAEGDITQARDVLRQLDEENRADAEVQMAVASHFIDRSEWELAEPLLRRARQLAPGWELPPHQLGRALKARGEYGSAHECLREAVTLNPSWAPPHLELGMIARAQNDEAEAASHLETAVHLDPLWPPPWFELAVSRERLGDRNAAIRAFDRAAELAPLWSAPILRAGLLRFECEDLTGARDAMTRVLAMERSAPALHVLGLIARATDGPAAAMPWIERAITEDSNAAESWFDLGACRRDTADETGAVAAFDRAAELKPGWTAPYLEGARCLFRLTKLNAAVERLCRASELGASGYDGWRELAATGKMIENWDKALNALYAAAPIGATLPPIEKELAGCLRALGKFDEAVEVLRTAVRRRPDWAGAHFELGQLCERSGRRRWAAVHYEHAARLQPNWQEAQRARARVCAHQPPSRRARAASVSDSQLACYRRQP